MFMTWPQKLLWEGTQGIALPGKLIVDIETRKPETVVDFVAPTITVDMS